LDESKERLNQIANALSISTVAQSMLRRRNLRTRILAIMTLGQLRERAAWDELLSVSRQEGALLSLAAARSLVMIDAASAVPLLIPILLTRSDWPPSRVAAMLQTAGADIISDQIANAAIRAALEESKDDASSEQNRLHHSVRMVRYLELAYTVSALPAARTIAQRCRDPEVLAACLQLLKSAEDLPVVRECVSHDDFRVRVQAATALGRIGMIEDESLLIPMLSDREWWVRYRAAQALSRLPSIHETQLKTIQAAQSNRFARDILDQVMAEVRW
jgi:HEAT repeat protein